MALFERFCPKMADLRRFEIFSCEKSPLSHFYFLFNCDKKF